MRAIEQRQGQRIACLEEIAFDADWIDRNQLIDLSAKLAKSAYGQYVKNLLSEVWIEIVISFDIGSWKAFNI